MGKGSRGPNLQSGSTLLGDARTTPELTIWSWTQSGPMLHRIFARAMGRSQAIKSSIEPFHDVDVDIDMDPASGWLMNLAAGAKKRNAGVPKRPRTL